MRRCWPASARSSRGRGSCRISRAGRTCELYWSATGRPTDESHVEEALEIAGLGASIDRRVGTYSHGMRQRLAIAQAMLGLPDLLVLDEPTNGLDPPQIHAMREVLRHYAADGRTVLVSSHLLAEVEQTCDHVVVMHHGRVVAAGQVEEIVAGGGAATFTVDAPDAAVSVLGGLTGVHAVRIERPASVHAELNGTPTGPRPSARWWRRASTSRRPGPAAAWRTRSSRWSERRAPAL